MPAYHYIQMIVGRERAVLPGADHPLVPAPLPLDARRLIGTPNTELRLANDDAFMVDDIDLIDYLPANLPL
jgi:hypothetical protein